MSTRRRTPFSSAFVIAAAVLLAASAGGTAMAQPTDPPAVQDVVIDSQMRPTGVDHDVARERGFAIETREDGTEYVVPTPNSTNPDGTPYVADAQSRGSIFNDCGEAYVFVHAVGGYVAEIETGFNLYESAVAYYWKVNRSDDHGSDSYDWGGGLAYRDSWVGEWDVVAGGYTSMVAVVDTSSDAILWDGTICTAGPATDVEFIFA